MDDLTQLALAAGSGDRFALGAFIERTQAEVWRLCSHLVSPDAADDLTQETYLRAIPALPGFRGEASARTWLLGIARRTCADAIRRRVRRRRTLQRLTALRPADRAVDPGGAIAVEHLVAGLDDDRRLAFVLTQVLGLGYAEAADVCGCPVGTIRSRVARARAQLISGMASGEEASAHALGDHGG